MNEVATRGSSTEFPQYDPTQYQTKEWPLLGIEVDNGRLSISRGNGPPRIGRWDEGIYRATEITPDNVDSVVEGLIDAAIDVQRRFLLHRDGAEAGSGDGFVTLANHRNRAKNAVFNAAMRSAYETRPAPAKSEAALKLEEAKAALEAAEAAYAAEVNGG